MCSIATEAHEFAELPLQHFFNDHYLLERELCHLSREHHYRTIGALEAFLGVAPTMKDLTDATVNRFLTMLVDSDRSRWTVKGYRQRMLALWNAAWQAPVPMVPLPPRRVKRITAPPQIIDTWTQEEIAKLIAAARRLPGIFRYSRVSRSAYWLAIISVAYDTGLRCGDILRLRFDGIDANGRIDLVQHKTQKLHTCAVRPSTLEAIGAIRFPVRPLIFGGVVKAKKRFYQQFRAIVKAAGIKPGTFRWLRRASGTHLERIAPGTGHRQLGNRRDVFEAHYCAMRLVDVDRPLPPALPVESAAEHVTPAAMPDVEKLPVAPLAAEFVESALPASYQANGKGYLGAAIAECHIETVGQLRSIPLERFLAGLRVKGNTRRHYRQTIVRFLEWLIQRGVHGPVAECLSELLGRPPGGKGRRKP